VLLATVDSSLYKIVFAVHILAAIIGFGGVALNGIYARVALDNQGPTGGAIAGAIMKASDIASYAIYSVPVWGIFLVILSDKVYAFSQPWVSASFTLYIVVVALVLAVIRPAGRKFGEAVADPQRAAEAESLSKTLAIVGGVANLSWVVILFLMVFKPGL
jgi:uncharacterized membrane protein